MKKKMCMIEDNKQCDNCCECNTCDLDPLKICDNCAKCLGLNEEYRSYTLKELVKADKSYKKVRLQKAKIMRRLSGKDDNSQMAENINLT